MLSDKNSWILNSTCDIIIVFLENEQLDEVDSGT